MTGLATPTVSYQNNDLDNQLIGAAAVFSLSVAVPEPASFALLGIVAATFAGYFGRGRWKLVAA